MSSYKKRNHCKKTDPTADKAIRNIEKNRTEENSRMRKSLATKIKSVPEACNGSTIFIWYDSARR